MQDENAADNLGGVSATTTGAGATAGDAPIGGLRG